MTDDAATGAGEPRICESCGVEFGCGARLEGCWCAEVKLSELQAGAIKSRFSDCLCPACLRSFAERSAIKITRPDRTG